VQNSKALSLRGSLVEFSNYKTEWILLLIGILFSIVSILLDIRSTDNTIWFARSGSIVVLVSAIVEYKLSSYVYTDIDEAMRKTAQKRAVIPIISDNPLVEGIVKSNLTSMPEAPKSRKVLSVVSHTFIITGTIIWGYGDLVVS